MIEPFTRRNLLAGSGSVAAAGMAASFLPFASRRASAAQPLGNGSFRYCLNTSTLRGQKLPLDQVIRIAAQAGYQAVEPWMNEIRAYVEQGGKLATLKQQIADAGLAVPSAIGFAAWIADDDDQRRKGLETAKQDMDLVKQIGATGIAAPPVGATDQTDLDLRKAAERYRALLELGESMEVVPQLEVWGFSKSLGRLSEAAYVAIESGHPQACLLPDVYHLYKGGSDFDGLRLVDGAAIHVFHMNDYPADPPRETIGDADRVYPGDGVAPLAEILTTLAQTGFKGYLSLELFNRQYWQEDPLAVARTGLEKMRAAVQRLAIANGEAPAS